jgi:hypothetical protein
MLRTTAERTRSRHDHNVVPHTQSATNVRAHKERLPFATFVDKSVMTMPGWDQARVSLHDRREAQDRANDYRTDRA